MPTSIINCRQSSNTKFKKPVAEENSINKELINSTSSENNNENINLPFQEKLCEDDQILDCEIKLAYRTPILSHSPIKENSKNNEYCLLNDDDKLIQLRGKYDNLKQEITRCLLKITSYLMENQEKIIFPDLENNNNKIRIVASQSLELNINNTNFSINYESEFYSCGNLYYAI